MIRRPPRSTLSSSSAASDCIRDSAPRPPPPSSVPACFKRRNLGLLELIQTRACRELRPLVFLVAGARLPAELVELIIDWTVRAEELPDDPRVWVQQGSEWRVGDGYVCGRGEGAIWRGV